MGCQRQVVVLPAIPPCQPKSVLTEVYLLSGLRTFRTLMRDSLSISLPNCTPFSSPPPPFPSPSFPLSLPLSPSPSHFPSLSLSLFLYLSLFLPLFLSPSVSSPLPLPLYLCLSLSSPLSSPPRPLSPPLWFCFLCLSHVFGAVSGGHTEAHVGWGQGGDPQGKGTMGL